MRFEHRQVNETSLLHETWSMEAAQALCARGPQFYPILFATLLVDTGDADAIICTESLYSQNGIRGLAIKLRTGAFTKHRFCATGVYFFGNSLEQGKAGGCSGPGSPASHKIGLE